GGLPRGDMVVEGGGFAGGPALAVREYTATVARLEPLSDDVMFLALQPSDRAALEFKAGQYINIVLDDGQRRAFSYAGRPGGDGLIELHVRLVPGGRFTTHVFQGMRIGDVVRIEGPLGQFTLRDSTQPILFVAGATGFAP